LQGIGIYTSIFCNYLAYKIRALALSSFSHTGEKAWMRGRKKLSSSLFFFSLNYRAKNGCRRAFLFPSRQLLLHCSTSCLHAVDPNPLPTWGEGLRTQTPEYYYLIKLV